MGRGRQKAKDAKIARQLKYSSSGMDLHALERELITGNNSAPPEPEPVAVPEDDPYVDRWSDED